MSKFKSNRRIKFAYQMKNWSYEQDDPSLLKANAKIIIPSEYKADMDGSLFCPACFTNLNRVPKEKEHFTNGREAYFSHITTYKKVKCDLKSIKPEGKSYENWEEAKKAIDDENLVIIRGFLSSKPEFKENQPSVYDETPIEDQAGSITEVSIGRHDGETFALPSRIETVTGICRNFDKNLYKYFHLPNKKYATRLIDLLNSVKTVSR